MKIPDPLYPVKFFGRFAYLLIKLLYCWIVKEYAKHKLLHELRKAGYINPTIIDNQIYAEEKKEEEQ